jgi:hypothetical protein
MTIHILTPEEWNSLQKIPDEMKLGKYAYVLPDNLNELGNWEKLK